MKDKEVHFGSLPLVRLFLSSFLPLFFYKKCIDLFLLFHSCILGDPRKKSYKREGNTKITFF